MMTEKFNLNASEPVETVANYDCLRAAVAAYESKCGQITEYGLKYVKILAAACNKDNGTQEHLDAHITSVCAMSF
jgi:hypothetical protein